MEKLILPLAAAISFLQFLVYGWSDMKTSPFRVSMPTDTAIIPNTASTAISGKGCFTVNLLLFWPLQSFGLHFHGVPCATAVATVMKMCPFTFPVN